MTRVFRFFLITAVIASSVFFVPFSGSCQDEYDYINISEPFENKIPMAMPAFKALSEGEAVKRAAVNSYEIMQKTLSYT
ncbi:MAG: hypothetical protein ACOC0W_02985, partial [Desulfosalsimonas sp.]